MGDDQIRLDVWEKKYRHGSESFDDWLYRVSGGDPEVMRLIKEKKFLPGGRILAGRGLSSENRKLTLSNCYVTDTDDSIEDIFETAKKIARTFSYGGGTGVDISKLAPKGAKVRNAANTSTGAVSFMDLYSLVTGLIGQNNRRGALMLSMSCEHPDIEEFIDVKNDLNRVNYANISVRMTNKFMEAVEKDETFTLSFTRKATGEVIEKTVRARDIFHKIAENNWHTGEPGMLFWDTICNYNMLSNTPGFEYAGINPCGEEPLPRGGSCCLCSMNLSAYVDANGGVSYFNVDEFTKDVKIAVTALNDILDEGLPLHPLQEQRDSVRKWRQIGLGIFGLADMLIKLNLTYGSPEAVKCCKNISHIMINAALQQSALLAKEYGVYEGYSWDEVSNTDFFKVNATYETAALVGKYGLRNSQLLTVAPTGSLSTMLNISGGIEPMFATHYTRMTKTLHRGDYSYDVYPEVVQEYMAAHGLENDSDLPEYFVTAHDIPYRQRIAMQAVWQDAIDASISSTINLPHDTTVEDIEEVYMTAWQYGLKGVTVFRDGCERAAILTADNSKSDEKTTAASVEVPVSVLGRGDVILPSDDLISFKKTIHTGCGKMYIHCDFDEATGEPLETYIDIGSGGGCERNLQFISRLMSLALRSGVPIEEIIDQANSIRPCIAYVKKDGTSAGTSCPAAIGHALKEINERIQYDIFTLADNDEEENEEVNRVLCSMPVYAAEQSACPDCGSSVVYESGCVVCKNCGWSRCG